MEIHKLYCKHQEFFRFCIVGVFSTLLDASIFYLVRMVASYTIALITGYCTSLILNYILTVYWTFQTKASVGNAVGIVMAHLFNVFVVRLGLMHVFVEGCMLEDRIAYIPTLMISVVTNFLIIRFVIKRLK